MARTEVTREINSYIFISYKINNGRIIKADTNSLFYSFHK